MEGPKRSLGFAASLAILVVSLAASVIPATPAVASEPCPNEAVRIGPSAALPDCRAYEQVTPVEKNGQIVAGGGLLRSLDASLLGVGAEGKGVLFDTFTPTAESLTDQEGVELATRTSSGWQSASLEPSNSLVSRPQSLTSFAALAASPDLSEVLLETTASLNPNDLHPGGEELYLRGPGGAFEWVSQGAIGQASKGPARFEDNVNDFETPGEEAHGLWKTVSYGASSDLSHVVFSSHAPLLPEAEAIQPGYTGLYERFDGQTALVDVNSDGALIGTCGAALGDSAARRNLRDNTLEVLGPVLNDVSEDGSRVFFMSPGEGYHEGGVPECEEAGRPVKPRLFVRENGAQTTEISAPEAGVSDPAGPQAAEFMGATPTGEHVYFASRQELTKDANTGVSDSADELYEYDLASHQLTAVSASSDPAGGQFEQIVGFSTEGDVVYFVAAGQIGGQGVEGGRNLYVSRAGTTTKLIATLGEAAAEVNVESEVGYSSLTPDGTHVLFQSAQNLTAYDSRGYSEVYEYDQSTAELTCISCSTGAAPVSNSSLFTTPDDVSPLSPAFRGLSGNNLSTNGEYAFFDSEEALVPQDTNHVTDVYEYHDGRPSLISGGTDPYPSYFLGETPSGSDVYFSTNQSLVPQDTDGGQADIYDARVDGGFAAITKPESCSSGDTCKGIPPAPSFLQPPTSSSPGEATLAPPPLVLATVSKPKPLTRAQKLARALRACDKDQRKARRVACEKSARKKYALKAKAKAKAKK